MTPEQISAVTAAAAEGKSIEYAVSRDPDGKPIAPKWVPVPFDKITELNFFENDYRVAEPKAEKPAVQVDRETLGRVAFEGFYSNKETTWVCSSVKVKEFWCDSGEAVARHIASAKGDGRSFHEVFQCSPTAFAESLKEQQAEDARKFSRRLTFAAGRATKPVEDKPPHEFITACYVEVRKERDALREQQNKHQGELTGLLTAKLKAEADFDALSARYDEIAKRLQEKVNTLGSRAESAERKLAEAQTRHDSMMHERKEHLELIQNLNDEARGAWSQLEAAQKERDEAIKRLGDQTILESLLKDTQRSVVSARDRAETAEAKAASWEEDARRYCENADHWKAKLAACQDVVRKMMELMSKSTATWPEAQKRVLALAAATLSDGTARSGGVVECSTASSAISVEAEIQDLDEAVADVNAGRTVSMDVAMSASPTPASSTVGPVGEDESGEPVLEGECNAQWQTFWKVMCSFQTGESYRYFAKKSWLIAWHASRVEPERLLKECGKTIQYILAGGRGREFFPTQLDGNTNPCFEDAQTALTNITAMIGQVFASVGEKATFGIEDKFDAWWKSKANHLSKSDALSAYSWYNHGKHDALAMIGPVAEKEGE